MLALALLCASLLSGCGTVRSAGPARVTQQQGQPSDPNYIAIGASDTFGIGATDPYTENWPADLTLLLKSRVHLINLGVPGMTVHTALNAELPVALDAHPALVTIWLAVNDLATNVPLDSYSHDLDTMLTRLQTVAPRARIAVGNVPDLTSVPFFYSYNPFTLRQQIAAYNTVIADVVARHHAILVDLSGQGYNLQEFPQYISDDGLHPSTTGYLQVAQVFYQALQRA
jgi:lysophospholipase L1-like esterase